MSQKERLFKRDKEPSGDLGLTGQIIGCQNQYFFFFFLRGLRTFCEGSHREKVFEKEVSDRKQESCLSVLPAPLAFSLHIINVAE